MSSPTSEEKPAGFYGIQSDLVNVSTYGKEKITFNPDRGPIVFYCHDCKKIVETTRPSPHKMNFVCNVCKSKKISYGTEESIREHYRRNLTN